MKILIMLIGAALMAGCAACGSNPLAPSDAGRRKIDPVPVVHALEDNTTTVATQKEPSAP